MLHIVRLSFVGFCFILSSCGTDDSQKAESQKKEDKRHEIDNLNELSISQHKEQYNAIDNKDTTIKFTYQLQEKVDKEQRPIAIAGIIKDISKKDSNYILNMNSHFIHYICITNIIVTPEQLQLIVGSNKKRLDGCFIFKPITIESTSLLKMHSEVTGGQTLDDITTGLTYDIGNLLILKGRLIDFYINKSVFD